MKTALVRILLGTLLLAVSTIASSEELSLAPLAAGKGHTRGSRA